MKAALLKGPYSIKIIDVEKPKPGPNQVLIKVRRCGICGSDLHAYKGKHPDFVIPVIPGHEFSGDVVEVGEKVEGINVGDKVCVEPLVTCGKCYFCLRGEYHRCVNLKVLGAQTNGAFTEYIVVEDKWVHKLPEGLSYEEGAMIEPLAVAVHAVKRAPTLGENVLILGAGTIGLLTLQVAKAMGALNTIITDIVDWKLEIAKKLGATVTVNPLKEDLGEIIIEQTGGLGVDTSFEAVGHKDTLTQALEYTRKGGNVVIIGVFETPVVDINIMHVVNKELNLFGSLVYNWDFDTALKLVEKGKVDVKSLVSDVIKLEDLRTGFDRMVTREKGIIKIQVGFD
ncbi:MAG: hypothetical protein DRJ59_02445 [Thermoprotei archaeon]|nr:MAG: hypothetical protein DRJ59_02445 [Thermoprotei archaeon]